MPLTPGGTRLGVYEVTTLIGEGGPPSLALRMTGELRRDLAEAHRSDPW